MFVDVAMADRHGRARDNNIPGIEADALVACACSHVPMSM